MKEVISKLIKEFLPYAKDQLGYPDNPSIFLRNDSKNAMEPLGKTAYYDPKQKTIVVYITNRHPKDILRSLSHELVHHSQNCSGKFDDIANVNLAEDYAQKNAHLRELEREAYEVGNLILRDWEDNKKTKKGVLEMSLKEWKNKELGTLLSETNKFGYDLSKLKEEKYEDDDTTSEEYDDSDETSSDELELKERAKTDSSDRVSGRDAGGRRLRPLEEEDKKPDADGDGVPDWADKKPGKDDMKNENKLRSFIRSIIKETITKQGKRK